jgi:hypothetical protein
MNVKLDWRQLAAAFDAGSILGIRSEIVALIGESAVRCRRSRLYSKNWQAVPSFRWSPSFMQCG